MQIKGQMSHPLPVRTSAIAVGLFGTLCFWISATTDRRILHRCWIQANNDNMNYLVVVNTEICLETIEKD